MSDIKVGKIEQLSVPGTESFIQDMNPYAGKYKAEPSLLKPAVAPTRCKLADLHPPINAISTSQHIKMSVRLPKGIVTSLTIKKNIIALWLLYTCDPESLHTELLDVEDIMEHMTIEDVIEDEKTISKLISVFVYKCLEGWENETGKGLSDFVTELMIEDFLDEYPLYENLMPLIKVK